MDLIKTDEPFNDKEYSGLDLVMSNNEGLEKSVDNEDYSGMNVSTSNAEQIVDQKSQQTSQHAVAESALNLINSARTRKISQYLNDYILDGDYII